MKSSHCHWYLPSSWFSAKPPPVWLLVLVLIAGIYLWQRTSFPAWMSDCFPNQLGAYLVATDQTEHVYANLHSIDEWDERHLPLARQLGLEGDLIPFFYAPGFAWLLGPFANMSPVIWRNIQFAINVLLLFGFAWLIVRLISRKVTTTAFLWALSLMLILYPLARATKLGQLVPLLAFMFWLGILMIQEQREGWGGALIGISAALKLFPVVVLAVLLLHRSYRALISAVLTIMLFYGLSIAILGIELHRDWWTTISDFGSITIPFWGNQSFTAWISRVSLGSPYVFDFPVASPALISIRIAAVAFFGFLTGAVLLKRSGRRHDNLIFDVSLMTLFTLIVVATAWEHYLLFALPGLAAAVYLVFRNGDSIAWEWLLGVALFFFTMKLTRFYSDSAFGRVMTGSQLFGMLFFWIWLLRNKLRTIS